jgi:hypothetical protein
MKTIKCIIVASFWLSILSACKEDENPVLQNKLVAAVGVDREIPLNNLVQLDGSGSSDGNKLPFTYHWTLKTRPANSSATLSSHMEAKPSFTPDQLGLYEVELKIANQTGEKTATVKLTAVANTPVAVIINQDMVQDRVLEDVFDDPGVPDYIVTADIAVKAKLTIMPGVVVAFEDKKGMKIDQAGSLLAKGTDLKKIAFTGRQPTKGYWSGIVFISNNPSNELLHVEVNYAGSHTVHPMPQATAIGVSVSSFLKLTHTAIQHSASNGLWVRETGSIHFANNVFKNNDNINITIPLKEAHKLDAETIIESKDETVNYVELLGSELKQDAEIVWKKLQNNVNYRIKDDLGIRSPLTIEKGAKIGVAPDKYIRILQDGSLVAKGNSEEPIIFDVLPAGTQKWRGIAVSSSNNLNRLEWVEIKNAGNGQAASGVDKSAAIGISNLNANRIHLKQVKIMECDGYGVFVHPAGMLGEFDQVTFSGIKDHVMALSIPNVRNIQDAQITTSNNLKNSVEIFEGNMNFPGETSWSELSGGITYFLPKSMQVLSGSGLKLMPGAKIEFGQNALLTINQGAYFSALGSPEKQVELKGAVDQPGYWTGILVKSNAIQNIIRYTMISGGGSQTFPGLGNARANIGVAANSGSVLVSHSNIVKGSGWGIVVESNFGGKLNADAETANVFEELVMGRVIRL